MNITKQLADALTAVLPYAENEAYSIREFLEDDGDDIAEADIADECVEQAENALKNYRENYASFAAERDRLRNAVKFALDDAVNGQITYAGVAALRNAISETP